MLIASLIAAPGGRLLPRLKRIGSRGLLALLTVAVLMLVSALGALLPDRTLPLTWYVPALNMTMVVTLAVAFFLCAVDVVIRRHGRMLPLGFASAALGMVWLVHMLTFPGVLPGRLPFVTAQTAPYLFHLGHIGVPSLLVWILLRRTGPLANPRRSLARTVVGGLGLAGVSIVLAAGLALVLPPLTVNGRFTDLNTLLQAVPFLPVVVAAASYRQDRRSDRRIEASAIIGLVLVAVETTIFLFMRAQYDGFWYVGHALMVLPCAVLLVGTVGLYVAARREAEVQLRVMERFKESQRHLQLIIDTSPSAVITADEQGLITGWNRKAEEIFGWSHDEAVGRTLAGTIIPRRYRDLHQRGMARFIETGEGKLLGRTVELSALHRDGREFPVEISVSPTSRSGSRVDFVAFVSDISHRRMADRLRNVQFAVTRPLANAATWAEAAPQVLQGICETLGWPVGEFWAVDQEANVLRRACDWYRPTRDFAAFEASSQELAVTRGVGLLGRVWSTSRARSIEDVATDPDSQRAAAAATNGLHAEFAFAVTNGRKVTGVIALLSNDRRSLDRATLRVMTDIGSQIGNFIERRRAEDELRRSGDRIRAILDNVADGIITVDERLVVRSYNPAAERLFGYPPAEVIGKDFARLIADPYRSEIKPQLRTYLRPQKHEVMMGSHETSGLTKDGSTFPMEFNVGRLGLQRLVIGSLRDVSERKAETEALQFRALHDPLTGLPNRTFLGERLEEAIRAGERELKPCALLLMDLDGFKEVNDSLGHEAGDQVLQQVSARMRAVLRKADTIARYGGDEFAVVPWGATDVPRAVLVAEKILQAVGQPFTVDGAPVNVSVSVGIAVFPQHAEDAEALIRRADVAMYAAKRAKSGYSVYSIEQDGGENGDRVPLVGKLRYAIDQFELVLHYQPIVSAVDGHPLKVEALVRWGHPKHGLLPPDDFIPSAEQSELIKPLTAWVLNEALGQVHAWSRAGIDIGVAVNLSARNLHDTELPDAVAELLRTWQVEPEKLTVEITERGVVSPEALDILRRLHAVGVRISLDDFGTGYSALAYLQHLPVDEIKIDKSFVQDMTTNGDQATIVRSTIDLGHNLGLIVVAEGVEDEATYRLLIDYGCDLIQGYHLGRPTTAAALGPWLRTRSGISGALSA
ncbi:MAG TPA: EAL domain-containing protein [Candidatus Dormibacteraeota bacterium]|nr:EAL domain-containing protein [Candidatus Dormibacteraeota bacterium]